jgi:hypothetical protein
MAVAAIVANQVPVSAQEQRMSSLLMMSGDAVIATPLITSRLHNSLNSWLGEGVFALLLASHITAASGKKHTHSDKGTLKAT